MNPGLPEEVGKTTRSFMDALREQPLSLALVAMNLILLAYLFYTGNQMIEWRNQNAKVMASVQPLLASCVSPEVLKLMLDRMTQPKQ